MSRKPVENVYPYLRVINGEAALDFYKEAFGARLGLCLKEPSGRIGHAELHFGDFTVMISDAYPEYGIHGPEEGRPTGSAIHMHVDDVDLWTRRAVEAGAELKMAPQDQFYGERSSRVLDPYGHEWVLGSHIEDVSPEEMQRRFDELLAPTSDEV